MEDRDLSLLRAYRARDAEPPPGLRERLEEDLWQAVLEEESRLRVGARPGGVRRAVTRWLDGLAKPAMVAGAAAVVAVGLAVWSDGGSGPGAAVVSTGVRAAGSNVLDATAATIFGDASRTDAAPLAARVDLREVDQDARVIAQGPRTPGANGEFAASLPRDSEDLRSLLRTAAAELDADDPGDRLAFHFGMQWVVDPAVPSDLRAAMLRSLDGLAGIDRAVPGFDALGRRGVVVSHFDETTGLREQYVLAPDGGDLLERRAFTTAYVDPACPPGTFTDYAVFDAGLPVDPVEVPWIAWPQVVDACDPGIRAAA